ncbi:MAG: hybrid sensor histidine kinase/response regulator, partial [Acidobacteria bacterium]
LPTDAFPRARRWLPLFYAAAGAGIVLDLTRVLPPSAFLIAALTSMMLSLALLIRRLQLPAPPATRMANRLMLFGVGIGTVPWVAMLLVLTWFPLPDLLIQVDDFVIAVGGLLALPNWPLSYLYAMYKYEAGTIQLRANRLFGRYSFLSLYVIFFVVAYAVIGSRWPPMAEHPLFTSLIISLVFVALAPLLQKRFQLLLDRLVFGIRYQPEEVVGVFAERLPSAFDRASLRRLVCGEILPTLQIRQSALYLVQHERVECLYDQAVPRGGSVRSTAEIEALLRRAERYIPVTGGEQRFAWVRLVIPLMVQDQPIGAWLLGRRDPDDFYPKSDVGLLHNLANQIATVLRAQIEILENRQLQKQLLHAQKMEAIGRLTAGISHDFNNILSAILGYSNLLRDHLHDDPRSQNYLDGILDAGKKAESLTKQLLSFSRRQAGDSQLVDVDATIRGMENLLRPLLAENIELILNLRAEHLIEADPIQIEQVILNLAVNAGDAMPGGGLLFIETSDFHRSSDESSADSRLAPGSYVRIQVRDTGTGMEPHVQQHIFEPFYTTKKEKGTGLGLATAYGIIHQCGGHIFADSLKGQGTTFHIYLPAAAAAERCAPQDERSAAALAAQDAGTILVAEDEEVVRSVVCEILRSRGYTVLQAPDGRAALELVEHHADPIDLLLTDVMMPHLRGDELAARLRDRRPEIKVIYMSGYTEQAVLSRSPGQDEVVLLQKPFMPDALVDAVRRVIGAGLRASGVR